MNDFTKEELQIILIDMSVNIIKSPPLKPSPYYLELRDKIRAMVDNYCEHKEEYEDFNYSPMRCKDCLEITG